MAIGKAEAIADAVGTTRSAGGGRQAAKFLVSRGMAAFFGRQGKKVRRQRCVKGVEAKPSFA